MEIYGVHASVMGGGIERAVNISRWLLNMKIVPVSQKTAKKFVNQIHRHHKAPVGSIFQIGLEEDGEMIGVIMVGRPVSRHLDDGTTLEINRTCVLDDKKNACSMLMGAACRAGKALGYTKIITYTLSFEGGRSLHAAGFVEESKVKGQLWNSPSRPREQKSLFQEYDKIRWVRILKNH